ncbi:O-acetyl-ADP-ribose deacetylase [Kushneria marisflavi]|uniref:O-acetyl-ADP-ribose deacetylase n=1 Tax=Kushneria marisflavi TaxID=157779 RepID=A0A240UMI8_9GAMM|nr:O-acetyl-ADP-ribose deacetylase [Kushneria marisflavi]ART62335.1 O-acetyl-ADP-ribose deacetylase [Kushneria marisflavi]RKD87440.1 O-acetyl-ADP-ribose deacetylase (regulator of RNase III) [Kushneria marisflavi]
MTTAMSWMSGKLRVIQGDITTLEVDAIVNAANHSLMGGGGVDGAIHRAAGPELKTACQTLRREQWPDGLPDGEVALTPGFNLPAHHVIHTVGPVYAKTIDKSEQLASCYRKSLALAEQQGLRTIAFPAISTGVYGYPFDQASEIVLTVMAEKLPHGDLTATLCFFSQQDMDAFRQVASRMGYQRDRG